MTEVLSLDGACRAWWASMIVAETGSARRSRAELRRAASVTDALGVSATHELYRQLAEVGHDLRNRRDGPDRLALIAVVLAHVAQDSPSTLAQRFGEGTPKALSGLRFDALIRTREPRQLMRPLVRALAIVNGGANVRRLATDLYWWNDRTRIDWCFDYHGGPAARPFSEETKT